MEDNLDLSDMLFKTNCIFYETFLMTIDGYSGEEKEKVLEFIIRFSRERTPYGLIQITTIAELSEYIFTDELNRDFVWKLVFNFFSTLGFNANQYKEICNSLAFALDVVDNNELLDTESLSESPALTPEELSKFHLTNEQLRIYLISNKWLVVLTLLLLNYKRRIIDNKSSIKDIVEKAL